MELTRLMMAAAVLRYSCMQLASLKKASWLVALPLHFTIWSTPSVNCQLSTRDRMTCSQQEGKGLAHAWQG
jgi:hypothetical protein